MYATLRSINKSESTGMVLQYMYARDWRFDTPTGRQNLDVYLFVSSNISVNLSTNTVYMLILCMLHVILHGLPTALNLPHIIKYQYTENAD